ncbi:DNRLRE domain-containing protein [Streptomyces sp. NPDC056500]|uniref:DNRLRE domain-containing protein n=1 Tax=Streptomyces sp. NPDC056500 TaxID=3345840 RepID=UPI00368CA3A3
MLGLTLACQAALVAGSGQTFAIERQLPVTAKKKDLGPASAGSEAEARLKAKIQKRRIEVLDARTDTSTTWVNRNGTLTTQAYAGPVRFRDAAGKWQDVDVSLRRASNGSVQAQGHPQGLTLAGKSKAPKGLRAAGRKVAADAVPLISLDDKFGNRMELGWYGALPEPVIEGAADNVLRYQNALPATDLLIESTRTGYEQFLELKDRSAVDANGAVAYSLTVKGLKAKAGKDGSVTFTDAKGKTAGVLPAPVMWDARVDKRSGERVRTAPVKVQVAQDGDKVTLTLSPDAEFLADSTTQFPVTIDPAINIGPSFDTFVQQGFTTDQSASTELKVGNNGSNQIARSFLSFPMKNITGKQVTSAKLNLFAHHSWSCSPRAWEVWSTGQATAATRWTAQPAWTTKQATSTQTKGYSSACNDGWVSADVKTLVSTWAGSGATSNHLGVRATDENDPYGWKRFNSGNAAANTPYLSVTYNSLPGVPTLVAPANAGATNDTTPTLSAKALDGDGDQVTLDYEVWTTSGSAAARAGSSGAVASGAQAVWTPTALAAGAYKWRVRSGDALGKSAWSGFRALTVDTTVPGTTAIASSAFPAGAWSGTPNANGDFSGDFTFTPPTGDVKEVQWKLDSGAWQSAPSAGSAVTRAVTFRAGKHTVSARTKDAAGNVSAQTNHTFHAGSGAAVLTPGNGERTARRVELTGQGKTGDTGARYQYRRGATDTWKDVPVANVRRKADNSVLTAWPAQVTAGAAEALVWNITDSLAEDGSVDIRVVFTDGTSSDTSPASTVTVDRNAGAAPSEKIGPGSVNLLTGDFGLSASDATAFDLTASRAFSSRRPTNGADQEGRVAIFGPQWTSGALAELSDSVWSFIRKTSPTSVAVVDIAGEETGFTATGSGWKAETGAEELTLTGSLTGALTLKDTEGATTEFAKVDTAATTWQVSKTSLPTEQSTTTVISEKVTVGGQVLARPKYLIAPTSAVTAATCAGAPSTKGCRVLEYQYATATTAAGTTLGDFSGQVTRIQLWSTNPGAANATATAVSQYAYDSQGRLREQWDPRISPALKTAYTYDSAGRVVTLTPPGELPWTFTYGTAGSAATAGAGMLLAASRPTLRAGTKDQEDGGRSVTSLVYDVPLTGVNAPHQLAASDTAAWGQADAPTDATAVFPADQVPTTHSGNGLTANGYEKATLTYTNASGRAVNIGLPGRHLTASQYDRFGNTVFTINATNLELALGNAPYQVNTQTELGILADSPAERARRLGTVSVHSDDGQRLLDEYGPLHLVTLTKVLNGDTDSPDVPAGTQVAARTHTVNRYDENRPTDGTATVSDQLTSTRVGATVDGYPADADVRTTGTEYDWVKGLPTNTITDPTGLNLRNTTQYDAQGRVIKTTLPKSNGTDAGARVTTYWSATGTGTCQGRPEWADLACTTGPAGKITAGGTLPDEIPTTTTQYDRWGKPTVVSETANGTTRTTESTYDGAGRLTQTQITGGTGTAVPARTVTYDTVNGAASTVADTAATIRRANDMLGRVMSYDDGTGNVTRTEYDNRNRKTRVTDSAPSTTTYSYDNPAGLPTRVHDSVMGTIGEVTGHYDSDGRLYRQTLPWNINVEFNLDPTGSETSRYWHWESGWTIQGETTGLTVHDQVATRTTYTGGGAYQEHTYDAAGRLTKTDDTQIGATTHRAYVFDDNSNRTKLTTTEDDVDGGAPNVTTTDHTYDSADRLTTAGNVYDAFGRTTTQSNGAQNAYYANDLVRQITANSERTTWALDAAGRLASWTEEDQAENGVWTTTATKTNHYGTEGDSPDWTAEGNGTITRLVKDLADNLIATTSAGGDVVLQLANLHGAIGTRIPLVDATTPVVNTYDDYGNPLPGTDPARYGWLGSKQRSAETPSRTTLMGVRLYDPRIGRFLSPDPLYGGGANAYGYPADPVNRYDLDGRKVLAKYNKNSRSCSVWKGRCVIKLSRARAWKASWDIIGGATAWGVSAALFGVASAGILAAVMGILAGVATWVAVNIQRVLSSFPNRGVKLTVYVYGRISISRQ